MTELEQKITNLIETEFTRMAVEIENDYANRPLTYRTEINERGYYNRSLGYINAIVDVYHLEEAGTPFFTWLNHEQRERFLDFINRYRDEHPVK